jgi:hypothetical protein
MVSLFDQIRLDILKHKELGLTEDEIAELPPLNIEIDEREFLGWLFNGQRANNQAKKLTELEIQTQHFTERAKQLGLVDKHAEFYVKSQLSLWEKEHRQKIADEAKLLGTAMQQLLPEIFEDKRSIPNCFLRGALFGMVRKWRRALVENQPIFTMSQYEVSFSGSELDQNDLEMWDTLMYLAKHRNVENELRITLYDLCQQLRISPTQKTYERLITRIERLQFGQVKITKNKKQFGGSLINNYYMDTDGDGKLVVEYNKKLTPLFIDGDYTLISADIRHLLGDNQLARWLYNFYESHNEPIPFAINFIQKLCRSESEPKEFKRLLKNALEMVKKAHLSVNIKSKWNYEISESNFLFVYPNGKIKKQLNLFNKI